MTKERVSVYSSKNLSKKIGKMKLSKTEAVTMKNLINELEVAPLEVLVKRGKAEKLVGESEIYSCKIGEGKRLMASPISEAKVVGAILHDVIDVGEKNFPKKGLFHRKGMLRKQNIEVKVKSYAE